MKQIIFIFATDLRHIVKNWAASIMILGLAILPSLYAWFNIEASWDPYGRTSGIRVAVVNKDREAVLRDTPIHIGSQIIDSLKDNKAIGWVFTDEEAALKGVQHGDYYASVMIPEDFSEHIATVLSDNPQKAELIYTVNEKINAIAPKITAKGASGILEEVSKSFVRTANEVIFDLFNEIGVNLQFAKPDVIKVRDAVFKLEALMPELSSAMDTAVKDVAAAETVIHKVEDDLPIAVQLAKDSELLAGRLIEFLDHSQDALAAIAPSIKMDLLALQQTADSISQFTAILQGIDLDPQLAIQTLDRIDRLLTVGIGMTDKLQSLLTRLDRLTGLRLFTPVVEKLTAANDRMQRERELASRIRTAIATGAEPAKEWIGDLNRFASEASDDIGTLYDRFDTDIHPQVMKAIDSVRQSAEKTRTLLSDAVQLAPEAERLLSDIEKGLGAGGDVLAAMKRDFPETEKKVSKLADRLRQLEQEGGIDELIRLLRNDPAKESDFFAEPVVLKENRLFPIPNYGSAMSPFFTTLSLWVGALLLVSLLSVEVHPSNGKPSKDVTSLSGLSRNATHHQFHSNEIYFGRYFTFLSIALLQSLFVTLGDIFLLKTYVVHKLYFVLFGLMLSTVFMLIVYTLVSVFGNVGKAIAIVFLVLQLAGSGGTFPIEVTPLFFQIIHPYLPFTYAISMMREAVAGIVWDIVQRDLMKMAVYASGALITGLALKRSINRLSAGFVRKAKESKLIH
jgi:putative membrane protein